MKHLLDTRELTREEAIEILDVADYMAQVKAENRTLNVLNGKTVVNLFFEDSTRTRLSFEAAEKRLGAAVTNFSASGSSLSKGESLKDTAQTLKAIAADAFVIRHSASGAPQRLAEAGWTDIPVLNAGDGTHAHPTQALLDAVSLRQYKAERDASTAPAAPTCPACVCSSLATSCTRVWHAPTSGCCTPSARRSSSSRRRPCCR